MSAIAHAAWTDDLLHMGVIGVAEALGVDTQDKAGKLRFVCTACNQETRHARRGDRRLSCQVTSTGNGWNCYGCGESGGTFDVLSFHLFGSKYATLSMADNWTFKLEAIRLVGGIAPEKKAEPRRVPEPPQPSYPDASEVSALWAASAQANVNQLTQEWLRKERCDLEQTLTADFVRALPELVAIPRWATHWRARGHKLLFKMYDCYGVLRSLEGRRAWQSKEGAKACGVDLPNSRMRLVFACPAAREALESGTYQGNVVWHEGPKKTLHGMLDDQGSIHIGIVSGSVTPELLQRFGAQCSHEIRTDADAAGARYATEIVRAMSSEQRRRGVKLPKYMKVDRDERGLKISLV